jgi:hypothetical protein
MTIAALNEILTFLSVKAVEVFGTISSRDIAIALWLSILVLYCLISEKMRGQLRALIKCGFQFKLVIIYVCVAAYTTVCLVVLDRYGVFTACQVKPAVLWMLTVAFTPMFKQKSFQEDLVVNLVLLVKSGLTYLALISFYIGLRPFNIWIEFLIGVPLIFILGMMRAMAGAKGIPNVITAIDFVFLAILAVVSAWTGIDVYLHPEQYSLGGMLLDFGIPVLLTLMYVPFAFLFTIVCVYELMFVRLNFQITNKRVALYAKLVALAVFNMNIRLAGRWFEMLSLRDRQSISDINVSLLDMIKIWWSEKTQKPIPASDGWSPAGAKSFLEEFDLKSGDYNWRLDNVFSAEAVKNLNDLNSLCLVAYRIRGVAGCVKKVVLSLSSLNVGNPPELSETKRDLIQSFSSLSQYLWAKALEVAMPEEIIDSILRCESASVRGDEYCADLDYETSDFRYEIKLTITKDDWADY